MTERGAASPDNDSTAQLLEHVQHALAAREPLYLRAGNSKRHLCGRDCDAAELDISAHRGIENYEPGELVLTARAATPLVEIQAALASEQQMLAFEPPLFDGRATLGGTLACNLSGPARPWAGSIRDMVLGVQLINGRGELLNFGGRVMKNVAGYDVSRLQAGALGTLGLMTRITLKVVPRPEKVLTLTYEMDAASAIATMNQRAGQPRPLTAACWLEGRLYLRLAGAASAVDATASTWGGEGLDASVDFWSGLRDFEHPYFSGDAPLWRFSINSNSPPWHDLPPALLDWGGAQRWLRGQFDPEPLQRRAREAGGHASLFRGGNRQDEVRTPLSSLEQGLHQRLKSAFDPQGIFNPGRLYRWI